MSTRSDFRGELVASRRRGPLSTRLGERGEFRELLQVEVARHDQQRSPGNSIEEPDERRTRSVRKSD